MHCLLFRTWGLLSQEVVSESFSAFVIKKNCLDKQKYCTNTYKVSPGFFFSPFFLNFNMSVRGCCWGFFVCFFHLTLITQNRHFYRNFCTAACLMRGGGRVIHFLTITWFRGKWDLPSPLTLPTPETCCIEQRGLNIFYFVWLHLCRRQSGRAKMLSFLATLHSHRLTV